MELTFVNEFTGDGTPKRKRLAKACDACRQRKKRCVHVGGANNEAEEDEATGSDPGEKTVDQRHHEPATGRQFVSDLKPEATFLPRRPPARSGRKSQNEDIGVWVDRREWDALVRARKDETSSDSRHQLSPSDQQPHSASLDPLIDIYFQQIHPILPLLDEIEFRAKHAANLVPTPLLHAVCVVAAKDTEAEKYLRFKDSPSTLEPRKFCRRLHASVMMAIRTSVLRDKMTLVRVLALASLHAEGPEGAEEASMCLTQALHHAQTLGWHLGQQTGTESGEDTPTKRLFWCLWSLDRMNSCIHGRPIMMSDVDIAVEQFEPGESGFPAFDVWMYLCRLLNKIISFYRPGNPESVTGWEDEYPSFEDALDEGRGWGLTQSVLATLHLFYLMLAVLSHRSRGVKFVPRNSPSYVRQSLCALELNRLMGSQLFDTLHPLPILPYAVSLALSVAYRHLRQAQLHYQQEDARQDFRHACQVVQKLRRTWSSVDAIAAISKTALERIDKIADLSAFRVSRETRASSPGICTAALDKPHTFLDERNPPTTNGAQVSVQNSLGHSAPGIGIVPANEAQPSGSGMSFDGMDDIFGTYLDPNNPIHFDDLPYMAEFGPFHWNGAQ